jgi:hypothetical protein
MDNLSLARADPAEGKRAIKDRVVGKGSAKVKDSMAMVH